MGLVRYKHRLYLVRLFRHWLRDLEELAGPSLHDLIFVRMIAVIVSIGNSLVSILWEKMP